MLFQNSLRTVRSMLDALEDEVQNLQGQAEVAEYEVTLFEQQIPSLKKLLASKYNIAIPGVVNCSSTAAFDPVESKPNYTWRKIYVNIMYMFL